MRLNTGDRRYQHHPEFLVSPQITPQQPISHQTQQQHQVSFVFISQNLYLAELSQPTSLESAQFY